MTRTSRRRFLRGAGSAAALLGLGFRPAAAGQEDYSEIVSGESASGIVALTFDAGGVAGPAAQVLTALRERAAHATFFLSGQWVEAYPELASQVAGDGHEIANHTYSHPDLTRLTDDQIVWELDYTDHLVFELTGQHTRPYFRPPFGSRNARVLRVAAAAGFRSVLWTLDSADWREGISASVVTSRVLRLAGPGDIVVQHVASEATAIALPAILDELAAGEWRVGTVSEVLGLVPLTPTHEEGGPLSRTPFSEMPRGFAQS